MENNQRIAQGFSESRTPIPGSIKRKALIEKYKKGDFSRFTAPTEEEILNSPTDPRALRTASNFSANEKFANIASPNVSTLPAWVISNTTPLIYDIITKGKTIDEVEVMTGIKSAEAIEELSSDRPIWQPLGSGFNASGVTAITQRILTVGRVQVQTNFDPTKLNASFAQFYLPAGSADNEMGTPIEAVWLDMTTDLIALQVEEAIWKSDTSNGTSNPATAYLGFFDGFVKIISGCTNTVSGNTQNLTGITTSTDLIAVVDNMITALPQNILQLGSDIIFFCGYDFYRQYTIQLRNKNFFYHDGDLGADYELRIPSTEFRLVAVAGLSGTNQVYASWAKNFIVGTDLEHDFENFTMWYTYDFNEYRMQLRFKLGTQIKFCQDIVYFKTV